MDRAWPPARSTSAAAAFSPVAPRASSATFAPRSPNRRAVARPMPPLAPVTTTVCCAMSFLPVVAWALDLGRRSGLPPEARLVYPPDGPPCRGRKHSLRRHQLHWDTVWARAAEKPLLFDFLRCKPRFVLTVLVIE